MACLDSEHRAHVFAWFPWRIENDVYFHFVEAEGAERRLQLAYDLRTEGAERRGEGHLDVELLLLLVHVDVVNQPERVQVDAEFRVESIFEHFDDFFFDDHSFWDYAVR